MITEIITTGTELLLGEINNTNAKWLAEFLNRHGFTVAYISVVGDNPQRMESVIRTALGRADLVITSGGLGATLGDITKKAGAEALGLTYKRFPEESERLRKYYAAKNRCYLPALDRQAWFAEESVLLPNDVGSASGAIAERNGKYLVHLPGPPGEMKAMAEKHMLPWLISRFGDLGSIQSRVITVHSMTESETEEKIRDLLEKQENPTIALLARPGYIAVRVTARGKNPQDAFRLAEPVYQEIRKRLPASEYQLETDAGRDLAKALLESKWTFSAAESCTGGLIGKLLTDIPGSSGFFKGSAVTYWNEAKENILGVKEDVLSRYTAVSAETAKQMAEGARRLYGSDIAVSTTGYAGPGPGERGEAPGLVYIGIAGIAGTQVYKEQLYGSRANIRYSAAEKAFYHALVYLKHILLSD